MKAPSMNLGTWRALLPVLTATCGLTPLIGTPNPSAPVPNDPSTRAISRPEEQSKPKIQQATLQVQVLPTATGLPVEAKGVEQEARSWLAQGGVKVADPSETNSGTAYHISIRVFTNVSEDGIHWIAIVAQCVPPTRGGPRRGISAPGSEASHPGWSAFHLAGHRGPSKFNDKLTATLREALSDLLDGSLALPLVGDTRKDGPLTRRHFALQDPNVIRYEFEQLKIRKQPPPPVYPPEAMARGIQGTVIVSILVDTSGTPMSAEAESGPNELLEAAIRHALSWEFEPALVNGKPTPVRFKLIMPFKLK